MALIDNIHDEYEKIWITSERKSREYDFSLLYPTRDEWEALPRLGTLSTLGLSEYPPADGYVYVIQDISASGYYKIGYTNHPATRLRNFGVKLPFEIKVVAIMSSVHARGHEAYWHSCFAERRVRGEWFDLGPYQLQHIRSHIYRNVMGNLLSLIESVHGEHGYLPAKRDHRLYPELALMFNEVLKCKFEGLCQEHLDLVKESNRHHRSSENAARWGYQRFEVIDTAHILSALNNFSQLLDACRKTMVSYWQSDPCDKNGILKSFIQDLNGYTDTHFYGFSFVVERAYVKERNWIEECDLYNDNMEKRRQNLEAQIKK